MRPEEVSLAIGKGGLNIKLACMLTEYTIDVFRDIDGADEEDIYLDEFSDEIDGWVIDALKDIGCYTAKSVLAMDRNALVERADLEEQTVDDVLRILSAEFEDSEQAEESTPEADTEVDAEGVAEEQEAEADPAAADDEKMND